MHESERSKPSRWVPFAWMPVYKEELAPNRPKTGYHSHKARRVRLEHQARVPAPSLARGLVSTLFKFATLGSGGYGKESELPRASQPARLLARR